MISEVYKKPESQGFHHNFPATHKSYNSAVEFSVALANHDMRKTWRSGSGVYGAMLEVVRASEFSLPGIGVTV